MSEPYTKKISLILPIDTYKRLDKLFERGERNRVMVNVIDWMCGKIERYGKNALIIFLRDKDFDEAVRMGTGGKHGND